MKGLANRFVLGLAAVAFLAPLKFGAPAMVQWTVMPPTDAVEWLYFTWPNELAIILIFAGFIWLVLDRDRMLARVDLLFVLPLFFLLTQMLAAPWTICPQETIDTVMLFAAGVLLFYVGAWYARTARPRAGYSAGWPWRRCSSAFWRCNSISADWKRPARTRQLTWMRPPRHGISWRA